MESFILWLLDVAGYWYSSLAHDFPAEIGSQYFDLAFAWGLCIIGIALIFIFALIPKLFQFVFSMFGRWGRN